MKIAVFGTPQLSANIFEQLRTQDGIEIVVAITAPDAPAGRGKKMHSPPVKVWADEHSVPVFQPEKLDDKRAQFLHEQGVELGIVISYGFLFSKDFLDRSPPLWNLHFSLLPKFRGASPVQSAILAGENTSGITVFRITPGLDDGPILEEKTVDIAERHADEVFTKLEQEGAVLLKSLFQRLAKGETLEEKEQNHEEASFCKKIRKENAELFPETETAEQALRKIRAFSVWPIAWMEREGKRLKIVHAELSHEHIAPGIFHASKNECHIGFQSGTIRLLTVRPEGKREMTGVEFARGFLKE